MNRARDLRVRPDLLYVASGWNVLVTDVHARIGADPHGFFARNTRVVTSEHITVDGSEPVPFSTANVGVHAQLSYAVLDHADELPSQAAYLLVEHFLGEGMRTRVSVLSFAETRRTWKVRVGYDADFADIDDVAAGASRQHGEVATEWLPEGNALRLSYLHPDLDYAVDIRPGTRQVRPCGDSTFEAELTVEPGGRSSLEFTIEPLLDGHRGAAPAAQFAEPDDNAARTRDLLVRELARMNSSNVDVAAAWQTAVEDLSNLALGEPAGPAAPFAGLPVYQQIFGRDSLTASWQAMLAGPRMLHDSLLLNAAHAGGHIDDWRDEEPGKLLHQARHGPVSQLGLDPFTGYYGDWSTTPAFLIFLGQYYAWTGDLETVRDLLPTARQALEWLDRYGDNDHDGFLEYHCRSQDGVRNQGWKDSVTAIVDEHGDVVDGAIAASELQGYWYAALRYGAIAFAAAGDRLYAAGLVRQAAALRRRFHGAYWMPEHGAYALALGPDKRQIRSVNSNDGHLLASGIVPGWTAPQVAARLLAPDMFSGWGIRTLSAEHPAYDPFSYHRGSVWPVEAGTTALGLARYGCWPQLHRLAEATFAATALFEGNRLPEVLGGLPRSPRYPHPGTYPTACSPQAWSASAIIALVQAMLGLRPVAPLRTVVVDPHLPDWLPDLHLSGVRIGAAVVDLDVRRDRRGRPRVRSSGDRLAVVHRRSRDTF